MTRPPKAPKAPPAFTGHNPFSGLDQIVGFHLRMAQGAVYRHFTDTFSDLGLTQKQVSVLWLISQNAGIAQADLGRMLQIDRATMMAIVNRLQERGLVVRDRSAVDGRRQTLTLTPTGKSRLAEARLAIQAHEEWLKSRFTAGEIAILVELLRRIHGQDTAPPKA
jgi:DNA-binding MarR family transcriptional regulator